jgi:uncharacterized lipoprotein YmbA
MKDAISLLAVACMLSGCVNLKPALDTNRFFVLTPLSAATPGAAAPSESPAVGIARVEIPDYLQPRRILVRKSDSELQYLETLQWAERLDKGIQRVLVVNLGSLLSSTNVVFSVWRRSDVQVEVYVSVQRFEVDGQGQAVLEARWRITNPGAEITWQTGTSRIIRQGPSLPTDPDGAVAVLNEVLGALSREIATAVRDSPWSRSHP